MSKLKLSINGNVQINYDDITYKSVVQDVQDDYFAISVPVANNDYLTLKQEEVNMYYYVEGESYFNFKAEVIGRIKEDNLPMYKLTNPYNILKIQRRNFVRVSTVEYVFYRNNSSENERWQKGVIVDLSGGGLRLRAGRDINLDDEILVNLFVNETKVSVIGKIVRLEEDKDNRNVYGVEFIEIDERKRDKIITKVFNIMRKQREVL